MASFRRSIEPLPCRASPRACSASALAWLALSAVCVVIVVMRVSESAICSRFVACTLASSARRCPATETSPDEPLIWRAQMSSSRIAPRKGRVIERTMPATAASSASRPMVPISAVAQVSRVEAARIRDIGTTTAKLHGVSAAPTRSGTKRT